MIDQKTAPFGALLLRLVLGAMFVVHGYIKWAVVGVPATIKYFATLGLPEWLVYPVIALEILGGLALMAGWYVRIVAIPLLLNLMGTILVAHKTAWLYTATGGGWEFPAMWAAALVAVAMFGDGPWVLDLKSMLDYSRYTTAGRASAAPIPAEIATPEAPADMSPAIVHAAPTSGVAEGVGRVDIESAPAVEVLDFPDAEPGPAEQAASPLVAAQTSDLPELAASNENGIAAPAIDERDEGVAARIADKIVNEPPGKIAGDAGHVSEKHENRHARRRQRAHARHHR
jgi:putative oxidoreductase